MRVFVTGATGFVGRRVTRQLQQAGHSVVGLARSDASAAALIAAGMDVQRGELADHASLVAGAAGADAVIHLGFIHDFNHYAAAAETDRLAIGAIGAALAGTGRQLLVTSGTAMLRKEGGLITEADAAPTPAPGGAGRVSEVAALAFADQGVRVALLRLPPSVHGEHDHGFVAALIDIARTKGVSAYVGGGDNRWPAVHVDDAARAYLAVLEQGKGPRYHVIGEEGIAFRDIAETIARKLGVPAVSLAPEAASEHFGWIAGFAQLNVPASSTLTRQELRWTPVGRGLLEDLELGTYFD